MDMSKLPKLSQTQATAQQSAGGEPSGAPAPSTGSPTGPTPTLRAGTGAEAWISIGIGLLLLLLTPNFLGYLSSKVFHTRFAPYPDPNLPPPAKCDFIQFTDGSRIYYRDSTAFWSDLAVTAFALTLILDGVVMVRARRPLAVLLVFCITVTATAGNLVYLLATFGSQGLALTSAFAVLFGGYIAFYQWGFYKLLRDAEQAAAR